MNKRMFPHERHNSGSMLVLMVAVVVAIILPCAFMANWFSALILKEQVFSQAAQSACLAAAQDLSKIVIEDPAWGFVSLSDYPAVGKATLAPDGEPLPVLGINTILATARQELLLAHQLNDPDLLELAKQDAESARRAAARLNAALKDCLNPESKTKAYDAEGNVIAPGKRANAFLLKCLTGKAPGRHLKLVSCKLSLGWLDAPTGTITAVPQPHEMALVKAGDCIGKNYAAGKDIAVLNQSFYFAALSSQAALVDARRFLPADGKRTCSALLLEAQIEDSAAANTSGTTSQPRLESVRACATPAARPDLGAAGMFALNFPHGYPESLHSLHEIFTHVQLRQNTVETLKACDGDYPLDRTARLLPDLASKPDGSIASVSSRAFLDWLRSTHAKPRLDSLVEMVTTNFPTGLAACDQLIVLCYYIDNDGRIVRKAMTDGWFLKQDISDQQLYAGTTAAIRTTRGLWTVHVRNQVHRLGRLSGGRHGGQPMKDQLPVDLSLQNKLPAAADFDPSLARRSFLRGGLAVQIEFSSPSD